jgi:hypothetical protein
MLYISLSDPVRFLPASRRPRATLGGGGGGVHRNRNSNHMDGYAPKDPDSQTWSTAGIVLFKERYIIV